MKFSLVLFLLLSTHAWAKWSITSYNIRNFDKDPEAGRTDMTELKKIITAFQSDVMGFVEVVNKEAFQNLMTTALPGYGHQISSCGGFGKQHLALAYNQKTFKFVSSAEDMSFSSNSNSCGSLRPVFLVTLEQKSTKKLFTFGVIHLKAGGFDRAYTQRWNQYTKINNLASSYEKKNLILLGDFNTTGYNIKDEDYVHFEEAINKAELRTMSESLGCTAYWNGGQESPKHQSSILDHIVLQNKNVAGVQDVKVGAHCSVSACRPSTPEDLGRSYLRVSDHCPIQVTFK